MILTTHHIRVLAALQYAADREFASQARRYPDYAPDRPQRVRQRIVNDLTYSAEYPVWHVHRDPLAASLYAAPALYDLWRDGFVGTNRNETWFLTDEGRAIIEAENTDVVGSPEAGADLNKALRVGGDAPEGLTPTAKYRTQQAAIRLRRLGFAVLLGYAGENTTTIATDRLLDIIAELEQPKS